MSGTTRESDKARAAQGSEQGHAITRGEEGPILAHDDRVRPVIAKALGVEEGRVYLTFANEPPYQLERIGIDAFNNAMIGGQREKAARAGIVPGADGWWWAAAAAPPPPPSWLTAAVLAALPANGEPLNLTELLCDIVRPVGERGFSANEALAALAHLVSTGEIETGPEAGTWRRPAPAPTTSTPQAPAPTRAEQVRLALLAVLTRGPVEGTSRLLPAVEAEMGAQPGSVEGRECREAAREIGAYIDGPRWSLPEVPHGWGWIESANVDDLYFLALANPPVGERPTGSAVAWVERENGCWCWFLTGAKPTPCSSLADGQTAALAAARRVGLFARPPAPLATVAEPVNPAPVLLSDPLAALASMFVGDTAPTFDEALDAFRAFRADILDASLTRTIDHYAAERARMMGGRPEDFRDMSEIGDGPVVEPPVAHCSPIPHAAVQSSLAARAYAADAPLLFACRQAATSAHDAYRAEGMGERFSRNLNALFDVIREGEQERDPIQAQASVILQRDTIDPAWGALEARAKRAERRCADAEAEAERQRERAKGAERERAQLERNAAADRQERDAAEQRAVKAEASLARVERGIEGMAAALRAERGVGK